MRSAAIAAVERTEHPSGCADANRAIYCSSLFSHGIRRPFDDQFDCANRLRWLKTLWNGDPDGVFVAKSFNHNHSTCSLHSCIFYMEVTEWRKVTQPNHVFRVSRISKWMWQIRGFTLP